MCGRFSNRYTWRELHALYELSVGFPPSNFQPHYNIAPTDPCWVVRVGEGGRELAALRWGLVPFWAKDLKIGASMINVRAETVGQKFRAAFEARPCLVVADGFYEWTLVNNEPAREEEQTGDAPVQGSLLNFGDPPPKKKKKSAPPEKQPYFIRLADGAPFAFGGLWERWQPRGGGDAIETFTVVTTPPNELCAQVHDRMPLVLSPDLWDGWLGSLEARLRLMQPFPAERMEMWPVDKRVGSVKNDDPGLVEPIAPVVRYPRR